jgi:hypothetical protein
MTRSPLTTLAAAAALAIALALATGCDTGPTPTMPDVPFEEAVVLGPEQAAEIPAPVPAYDDDTPVIYRGSDLVTSHGLEEGDEIQFTIGEMVSTDVFRGPDVHKYTYRVSDGSLVPIDGGPDMPAADDAIPPLNIAMDGGRPDLPTSKDEAAETMVSAMEQNTRSAMARVFEHAPPEKLNTTAHTIKRDERLDTVAFLDDLVSRGVEVQFQPAQPGSFGAAEVVELYLDGNTRAAVEQFDDPKKLAEWVRINEQLMTDLGLDPEQHMVQRGMTLVRFGPSGHPLALERTRVATTVPAVRPV